MKQMQRQRRGERAWRELLRRFEAAGIPVGEFCAREGLSTQSFYRWRSRLEAQVISPGAVAIAKAGAPGGGTPGGFIELGPLSALGRGECAGVELRLELGGGVVLQIVRR